MSASALDPVPGVDNTFYTQDMDAQSCQCGKCDGYTYGSPCHPSAGVSVEYRKSKGVLLISCAQCHRHYETIAVAKRVMH